MIYIKNKALFKEKFIHVYNKLSAIENNIDEDYLQIEASKSGANTLLIARDGLKGYIHSKYDPIKEAQIVIDQYKDIENYDQVLFYGVGLGYHIDIFLKKYPGMTFSMYEPIPEVFYQYIWNRMLPEIFFERLRNINVERKQEDQRFFFEKLDVSRENKILIIELPSYKRLLGENRNHFFEEMKKIINEKISVVQTNASFEALWVKNSMKNMNAVLNTPNILAEKKGAFKNQPAMIISAGPSLKEELENIRKVKEKGLAYIFAVGSSIKTLIENNIKPHAVCSYDPQEHNYRTYDILPEKGIEDIPLIFASSVGYTLPEFFEGPQYHMLTTADPISKFYLRLEDKNPIEYLEDAPTIAILTLQLLYKMGFNPIILVGQNLAYKDGKIYSDEYMNEQQMKKIQNMQKRRVKDVYGNEIDTNDDYNIMRQELEKHIAKMKDIDIMNTTKGGAHIRGTRFVPLEEIVEETLVQSVVKADWLKDEEVYYDIDYAIGQCEVMKIERKKLEHSLEQMKGILEQLEKSISCRKYQNQHAIYAKLDQILEEIQDNEFFRSFIYLKNRSNIQEVAQQLQAIRQDNCAEVKMREIVSNIQRFMGICEPEVEKINFEFEYMQQQINASKVHIFSFFLQ